MRPRTSAEGLPTTCRPFFPGRGGPFASSPTSYLLQWYEKGFLVLLGWMSMHRDASWEFPEGGIGMAAFDRGIPCGFAGR